MEPRDPYDDVPPEEGRTEVIEQEEQVPPPPWWREHWWVPLLVLLLLVGALLAFAFLWGADDDDDRVAVPDVVGLQEPDAREEIVAAGLEAQVDRVERDAAEGEVVAQEPDSGSELDEGSVVRINVSLGPGDRADATVPDLTGPEIEDALEDCHDGGFTCRVIERAAPDEESRGESLDQRPGAGTSAPALTQITLFLGV